jgi:hypothetical protein
VTTARDRLILAALVLTGYGVSLGYRSGRPDTLMLLLAALAFLASTLPPAALRRPLLAGVMSLFPLAGLALLPFAVILGTLLLLFRRRAFIADLACLLLGLAAGTAGLVMFYARNGVLADFLASMRADTSTGLLGALLLHGAFSHENKLPKDFSLAALLLAGMLIFLSRSPRRGVPGRGVLAFGLAAAVVIPIGMVAAGKFPTYYSWMAYVPLAVGVCSSLGSLLPHASRGGAVWALLVSACLLGLPLQLGLSAYDWEDRGYGRVEAMVEESVQPEDWAFTQYGAYYPARRKAAMVFLPHSLYRLTPRERERLTLLILAPDERERVIEWVGGEWGSLGAGIRPRKGTLFEDLLGRPLRFGNLDRKYELQAFRRSGYGASR